MPKTKPKPDQNGPKQTRLRPTRLRLTSPKKAQHQAPKAQNHAKTRETDPKPSQKKTQTEAQEAENEAKIGKTWIMPSFANFEGAVRSEGISH